VILNPAIDLPGWIPVVGQMDVIALTVLAVRTFNAQAPRELREEIESDIRAGKSRFDLDLRQGAGAAARLALLARTVPGRARGRARPLPSVRRPAEPAPWYGSPASAGGRTGAADGEAGSDGPLPPAIKEQSI